MSRKVQRNSKCPCGSGKKFKKCCIHARKDKKLKITPEENERFASHVQMLNLLKFPYESMSGDDWQCGSVEVRDSPIAGRGLFAIRDIPAWSIVTFYPVHYLEHSKEVHEKRALHMFQPTSGDWFDTLDEIAAMQTRLKPYKYTLNQMHNTEDVVFEGFQTSIYGDPDIVRPYALGHLINDACSMSKTPTDEECERYFRKSINSNVVPHHFGLYKMAIVTTRPIQCGEELLLTYGAPYWCKDYYKRARAFSPSLINLANKDTAKQRELWDICKLKFPGTEDKQALISAYCNQ